MNNFFQAFRNITYSTKIILSGSTKFSRSPWRYFHSNRKLCIKMFMEHENNFAYGVMENKGYAISLLKEKQSSIYNQQQFQDIIKQDWSRKSPQELFEMLPKLGSYCSENSLCISDTIFDSFIDNLTDNINYASDEELQTLFESFSLWPEPLSVRLRNYIEIWAALDDECLKRLKEWSFDTLLTYISLFYKINVIGYSDFTYKALQKLANKAQRLTPNQLVQTLFFIGVYRKAPMDIHFLEVHIEKNFDLFSLDELAIISMGFFKSKTPIRSMEFIRKLMKKVSEESKNVQEVPLAALLKIIRYSMKLPNDNEMYDLIDRLVPEIPRLSVTTCVHLVLLGTASLTFHKECLNKVAEHISTNMSAARMKDLERLVLAYGMFNFIPQIKSGCLFENILQELRNPTRNQEIQLHKRSFALCVSFFGVLGIHPIDLMDKILDKEFLMQCYGKALYNYGKEVLSLHNTASLYCKDTVKNRLTDKEAMLLAKKYTDYIPNRKFSTQFNHTERLMLDIIQVVNDTRGGPEYWRGDHILSHYQRGDIIICNDKNGVPVKIDTYPSVFGKLLPPPDDNDWIALVVGGKNAFLRNSNTPTGHYTSKIRDLKALGYKALLIGHQTWLSLRDTEEKSDYLELLIKEISDNKNQ